MALGASYESVTFDTQQSRFPLTIASTGWTLLITTPAAKRRLVQIANNDATNVLAVWVINTGGTAPQNSDAVTSASYEIAPQSSKPFYVSAGALFYGRAVANTCTVVTEEWS